jgi:protoheme IX farnesyltransferase
MSAEIVTIDSVHSERGKFASYIELTKPRISIMVLVTVAVAAYVASPAGLGIWTVVHAIIGTFLIASSGSALNQYIERFSDFAMARTARRPLPAQKLSAMEVAKFGTITFGIGMVYLATTVNLLAALFGLLSWIIYVWIYTPLKRHSWLNTVVGAVSGAMPILIGWSATQHGHAGIAIAFFAVLFIWQFPHFMAIAWKYRDDYQQAGLKMLTNVEPTGVAAGWCAVLMAAILLPVSLVPVFWMGNLDWIFAGIALGLGLVYLYYSVSFLRERNLRTAKSLLRSSLIYLPAYMLILVLGCKF